MIILRKVIDTLPYAFYIVSNCGISLKMNVMRSLFKLDTNIPVIKNEMRYKE